MLGLRERRHFRRGVQGPQSLWVVLELILEFGIWNTGSPDSRESMEASLLIQSNTTQYNATTQYNNNTIHDTTQHNANTSKRMATYHHIQRNTDSPLHNVKPVVDAKTGANIPFPATLITTSDHDDRVVPLHSFKMIAALQHAGTVPIAGEEEGQSFATNPSEQEPNDRNSLSILQ